jgi:outer membrane protein OmpA-like peptidoglycan-associated protein
VTLDAPATAVVNELAATVKRLPAGAVVKVTGWSDTRSGERTALEQSKARADAVVAALRAAGATAVTYTVSGAGGRWAAVYADARVVEVDLP